MNYCRFDAIISCKGMTEKIVSGMLDQLVFHLPGANDCQSRGPSDSFKLELTRVTEDVSWFTKSTLSRYSFYRLSFCLYVQSHYPLKFFPLLINV